MEIINVYETHLMSDETYIMKMLLLSALILVGVLIALKLKQYTISYILIAVFAVTLGYFLYNGFFGAPTYVKYDIEVDGTEEYIEDVINSRYNVISKNGKIWTCEPRKDRDQDKGD